MIERKYARAVILAIFAGLAAVGAQAANDLFQKDGANSRNGFLPATDPTYVKECGACHFRLLARASAGALVGAAPEPPWRSTSARASCCPNRRASRSVAT
jgi:hypothetical protein